MAKTETVRERILAALNAPGVLDADGQRREVDGKTNADLIIEALIVTAQKTNSEGTNARRLLMNWLGEGKITKSIETMTPKQYLESVRKLREKEYYGKD